MAKFPTDAPINRVIRSLELLGFRLVREGNHIAMKRENQDGTKIPLTIPNHRRIKDRLYELYLHKLGYLEKTF
jgi:predicted RNA binding protein YcfA (HicA-like mRNA interferase family)